MPGELRDVLEAEGSTQVDDAWSRFLEVHSPLFTAVTRSLGRDHDQVMDRYAYVLEQLRANDFHRLRSFPEGSSAKFGVWLVAVSRRLCVDHHRAKYGRTRPKGGEDAGPSVSAVARKNLVDFIVQDIEVTPGVRAADNPEEQLLRNERREAVLEELAGLSDRERLLLKLRFEEDVSVREIATVMRYPSVFHVYRGLKSVMKTMEERLRSRGITTADP